MDFKNADDIKQHYDYDNKMLLVHYCAVSGELPVRLIKSLGISDDLRNYIVNRGPFKDFFIYRKGNGMTGYQLRQKAVDYLLQEQFIDNYYPFITSPNGNSKKATKDVVKRRRAQMSAELYYLFDKLGIDYLPTKINPQSNKCFYPSILLKHSELNPNGRFEVSNEEKHEMKGSRMFGTLKNGTRMFNVYCFNEEIPQLDYALELRAKELVNSTFIKQRITQREIQSIFYVSNQNALEQMVIDIINNYYSIDKIAKYKFFREMNYNEMHFIPLQGGERQLKLLHNKKLIENSIKKQLDSRNSTKNYVESIGMVSDYCYQGYPTIFLYSLDVVKLRQFYFGMMEFSHLKGFIVCTEEFKHFIKDIFTAISDRVQIIVI